jgi:hypothetical protein
MLCDVALDDQLNDLAPLTEDLFLGLRPRAPAVTVAIRGMLLMVIDRFAEGLMMAFVPGLTALLAITFLASRLRRGLFESIARGWDAGVTAIFGQSRFEFLDPLGLLVSDAGELNNHRAQVRQLTLEFGVFVGCERYIRHALRLSEQGAVWQEDLNSYSNGERRIYDCSSLLEFGVFKELKNKNYFFKQKLLTERLHGHTNKIFVPTLCI